MSLNPALMAAYRSALYLIKREGIPREIKIGQRAEILEELLNGQGSQSAAFLTACNPASCLHENAYNLRAMASLLGDVQGRWTYVDAEGADPLGQWPSEPSVLVLGISFEDAAQLAFEYGQNAFLFIDENLIPRLAVRDGKAWHFDEQ
jgi:hypothetical protein